jgi:hypothetical protein
MRTPLAPWLPAAFALLSLASTPAWAAPSAKDRAEARTLAAEARTALKAQRFEDAVEGLRRADQLDPSSQLKLDLARALVGAGKLVEASSVLHQLDGAPAKSFQEKKNAEAAKKLVGEVESKIPWVQISVTGPKAEDASTTLDGNEIDASSEVPVDPGEHVVVVEAEGWKRAEEKVKLAEGVHEVVRIKMEREAVAEAPPPAPPSSGGSKLPAAIAFGVGAAGFGVGVVFGLLAFDKTGAAKERCDGDVCPDSPKLVALRDQAVTYGNISTAGFIAGGVGVATGIVLLITSSGSSAPEEAGKTEGAWVEPWVGPGQAGLAGAF